MKTCPECGCPMPTPSEGTTFADCHAEYGVGGLLCRTLRAEKDTARLCFLARLPWTKARRLWLDRRGLIAAIDAAMEDG